MPRRGRYGRHYGGGEGPCGCCNYWNQDEEEVAQELIKEKAKKSCTGKAICCDCDILYDRHNIKRLYIFAGIAFGLLLVSTMGYSGNVYGPAKRLASFKKSECTVREIEYNNNFTDRCKYTEGRSSRWRDYKCLRIHVMFRPKDVINNTSSNVWAIIADEYVDLGVSKHSLQCTTRPRSCSRHNDLEQASSKMYRYYKDVIGKSPFKCMYDPEMPQQVITEQKFDVAHAKSIITLLAFITIILFVLLLFMCCTCGCQYVCAGRRVPYEIQQEVQKRRAENQGLTAGNPPQGGPTIYVGQPVQMVPATNIMPPPVPGAQPLPMQPMQPPMGPQYGQYPPQMAPQPGYPAPQPGYPAPQPGYPQQGYPQPGYAPPPQQGQYPPQNAAYPPPGVQAPPYTAAAGPPPPGAMAPPPGAVAPPPDAVAPPPGAQPTAPFGGYQPPAYAGMNTEAQPLPDKPPMA